MPFSETYTNEDLIKKFERCYQVNNQFDAVNFAIRKARDMVTRHPGDEENPMLAVLKELSLAECNPPL